MKNEYTSLSMGGKNVIIDLLKFIPFYTSTRWYNPNLGIQNISNYKIEFTASYWDLQPGSGSRGGPQGESQPSSTFLDH